MRLAVVSICAILGLFTTLHAANAAPVSLASTSETSLGPAPAQYEDIDYSGDGLHLILYGHALGQTTVSVDGKKSAPFVFLEQLAFSSDNKHMAYIALTLVGTFLVADGKGTLIIGEPVKRSLQYSPDGSHLSYCLLLGDKQIQVVDGRAGPAYEQVDNLIFSADGKHFAYTAKKNQHQVTVVDGVEWPSADGMVVGSLNFNADGKHASYVALDAAKPQWVLMEDGKVKKQFPILGETSLSPSPDNTYSYAYGSSENLFNWQSSFMTADHAENSPLPRTWYVLDSMLMKPSPSADDWAFVFYNPAAQRVANIAKKGAKEFVVVDGKPEAEYDGIARSVCFSKDGQHLAYAAIKADKMAVVSDGKELTTYDAVVPESLCFIPENNRLLYAVQTGSHWMVVMDGKEGPAFDALGISLVVSPDGKHFAYTGQRHAQWFVVVDGRMGAAYDGLELLTFTPDNRVIYSARKGQQWTMVLDGQEGPLHEAQQTDAYTHLFQGGRMSDHLPSFSTDGKHVAYVAQKGAKQMVIADGKEGPLYDGIINTSITFSADGQHLAYQTFNRTDKKWTLVLDGAESEKYNDVGGLAFWPDGTLELIAQKGAEYYRIKFAVPSVKP